MTHPPGVGFKAKRIAFAAVSNPDAEELVAACIADLTAVGELEVVDRGAMEAVLGEQRLSNSGLVESDQAVAMGRLLGSPLLLFVKVFEFSARRSLEQLHLRPASTATDGKVTPAVQIQVARTEVTLRASVQVMDCSTGKVVAQKVISASPSEQCNSGQGLPFYPGELPLRSAAVDQAKGEIRRLLLPWSETRKLTYFCDRSYGLKEAYPFLQGRDFGQAKVLAQRALDRAEADARVKPRDLGRAHYNLGLCYLAMGRYPEALARFQRAEQLEPEQKTFRRGREEGEQALRLHEAFARMESRPGGAAEPSAQGL